jgi:hypothetical protein
MHICLILTFCLGVCYAENYDSFGLPDWILPGILMVGSSSNYLADGSIRVGSTKRGRARYQKATGEEGG